MHLQNKQNQTNALSFSFDDGNDRINEYLSIDNFISESMEIKTEIENSLVSSPNYKLSNPLVALCIGKYCQENEAQIKVNDSTAKSKNDHIDSKYCFHYKVGYSIIYMVDNNNNNDYDGLVHVVSGGDIADAISDGVVKNMQYYIFQEFDNDDCKELRCFQKYL